MEPYWDLIREIVRESDIVLEIVDARLVDMSRNKQLDEIINNLHRTRIIVVNKADLVSQQALEDAMTKLKGETKSEVIYVSSKSRKTIKTLLARIRQVFARTGKRQEFDESKTPLIKRPFREAKGDIIVGVVGYPNVGKSSIINALSFKKKMAVSKKAGTTHGIHWIKANEEIKLIDSPGVIPLIYEEEAKLGMIAAKNAEKMKDPETVAGKIIEMYIKKNELRRILNFYSINNSELEKTQDSNDIITAVAFAKKHLKKGGLPDEMRTSIMIIHDWQEGKLKI